MKPTIRTTIGALTFIWAVAFSFIFSLSAIDDWTKTKHDSARAAALASAFVLQANQAHAASTIHIPDAFLASYLQGGGNLSTGVIKCALIDISTYNRATDVYIADVTQIAASGGYTTGGQTATVVVAADTTNHWTTITITPANYSGSTTMSATGAACYDSSSSNRLIAVDDFGATVASSGGTYTVGAIVLKFLHF